MPNPLNRVRKEQWDNCDICGLLFPMSKLTKQKGAMRCPKDIDNLEIERREQMIMKPLSTGIDQEGVDTRIFDRNFFDGFDNEVM